MNKWIAIVGSVFLFLGVLLGAFGAHGLKAYFLDYPYHKEVFQKANLYQFIHGLALLFLSLLPIRDKNVFIFITSICFGLGVIIFSGSLYVLSVTQIRWLGMITPFGGILFLLGWIFLMCDIVKR